jgi:hypothetical protein
MNAGFTNTRASAPRSVGSISVGAPICRSSRMPPASDLLNSAYVSYTCLEHPRQLTTPRRTEAEKRLGRRADARLRVAMRDAWADPVAARAHLEAATFVYASMRDAQGMANALLAHADTIRGDAHLASLSAPAVPAAQRAARRARAEYLQAAQVYSALAEAGDSAVCPYDARRQRSVWAAMREQRRRPLALTLGPRDALACLVGGDENPNYFAAGKARWHHTSCMV